MMASQTAKKSHSKYLSKYSFSFTFTLIETCDSVTLNLHDNCYKSFCGDTDNLGGNQDIPTSFIVTEGSSVGALLASNFISKVVLTRIP